MAPIAAFSARRDPTLAGDPSDGCLHPLAVGREREVVRGAKAVDDERDTIRRLKAIEKSFDGGPQRDHPLEADVQPIDEQDDQPAARRPVVRGVRRRESHFRCGRPCAWNIAVSAVGREGDPFGADDAPPLAVDVDDEVGGPEAEHRPAVAVDDGHVNGDDFDAALKPRRLLILGMRNQDGQRHRHCGGDMKAWTAREESGFHHDGIQSTRLAEPNRARDPGRGNDCTQKPRRGDRGYVIRATGAADRGTRATV